jgi:hypothetical protein
MSPKGSNYAVAQHVSRGVSKSLQAPPRKNMLVHSKMPRISFFGFGAFHCHPFAVNAMRESSTWSQRP